MHTAWKHVARHVPAFRTLEVSESTVDTFVWIASGRFDPRKLTVFSIFRDEMYFARAFFDHYRRLGAEQFLILDDGSIDGTEAFLRQQTDCVTLKASVRYGEVVWYRLPNGELIHDRAGIGLKALIPHRYFQGRFALYADADEFLLLPDGAGRLQEVIAELSRQEEEAVVSALVEMFPERLDAGQSDPEPPRTARELFGANPWFEATPHICLTANGTFDVSGGTKSDDLFHAFGIRGRVFGLGKPPRSPRFKTPILRHSPTTFRLGSHSVNVLVSPRIMLPMAHFVFTPNMVAKAQRARRWRSHARNAAKYDAYVHLVGRMAVAHASLTTPSSQRLSSARDLEAAGLMLWPRAD